MNQRDISREEIEAITFFCYPIIEDQFRRPLRNYVLKSIVGVNKSYGADYELLVEMDKELSCKVWIKNINGKLKLTNSKSIINFNA
jgi:hypothetical protein